MEEQIHPILKALIPVADGIAEMLGSECEVAIHDLTHPQHSIIHIVNGHVSGRKTGDTLGKVFKEFLQLTKLNDDRIVNYYDYNRDTHQKCTKILIRDDDHKVIGCFCINWVIDDFIHARDVLDQLCKTKPVESFRGEEQESGEDISTMVKDLIIDTIQEVSDKKKKLTKERKLEVVKFLDEKGVFKVKGSVEWVAQHLHVSRFTIYGYLDKVRASRTNMS